MSAYGQGAYGQGVYGIGDASGMVGLAPGGAQASGSLAEQEILAGGASHGSSAVTAFLGIAHPIRARSDGHGAAAATLGAILEEHGFAHGLSVVAGTLGKIVDDMTGVSAGSSTVQTDVWEGLTVTRRDYIEGAQGDDWYGYNEDQPPMGGPTRDRAHFTPRSSGHATSKPREASS